MSDPPPPRSRTELTSSTQSTTSSALTPVDAATELVKCAQQLQAEKSQLELAHSSIPDEAFKNAGAMLIGIGRMLQNVPKLRHCVKTVYFANNCARDAEMLLFFCRQVPGTSMCLSQSRNLQDILDADFVVVKSEGVEFQPDNCTMVQGVTLQILNEEPTIPGSIFFTSGGKYLLSDGYSVRYCRNLSSTVSMELRS
ncbi:hypothetical protein Pelo_15991 [Pelomyxa schiedti]|nr:hypothetical protein Pelo_15991 [Pelomyxa schiedti]